ncbi:MAG: hypothetical protein QM743_12355 [Chitinophagaceae bacterium]
MGIYTEYLSGKYSFEELTAERKKQLSQISQLRNNRDVLVYASDIQNRQRAPNSIEYSDLQAFKDQISNLNGEAIDIILETPGGVGEIVEDLVKLVRSKYNEVGIIIPGTAKSAGTIFAMAGDEILMSSSSSLGPIDAQIMTNSKKFSADAFLEGLEKIKADVLATGRLNPAYIPILQNISPGEIQNCENAQKFSQILVREWLRTYKFAKWTHHSSTGELVTDDEKANKAKEIAEKLCKHSDWLTHGRSIKIGELENIGLKIINYEQIPELDDAISRYYTLLQIVFETTNIYKVIETTTSQILRYATPEVNNAAKKEAIQATEASFMFKCPKCHQEYGIVARFDKNVKITPPNVDFPENNIFVCSKCGSASNLINARIQIESQSGKKIIH